MRALQKKLLRWCRGGQDAAFYRRQAEAIHKYNAGVLSGLLPLLTCVFGGYALLSGIFPEIMQYRGFYILIFSALLALTLIFRLGARKSIRGTRICIGVFTVLVYAAVCLLGTVLDPGSAAVMFLVYLLGLPMLLIVPIHISYSFFSASVVLFSILAYRLKTPPLPFFDTIHSVTCLILGFFLSHRVLESRVSLLALNERLSRLSRSDALTGLPNRLALAEFLQRCDAPRATAAMIDVDDFKRYNDTYGHPQGDIALQTVAELLRRAAMPGCFAARYGGEEFLFIDTVHTPAEARERLEALRCALYERNIVSENAAGARLTLSIGCAVRREEESFEALIQRADDALYQAKSCGKNCVRPSRRFIC